MEFLKKEIASKVEKFGIKKDLIKFEIPKEEFGDLALPCFQFSKLLKKNPNKIAKEISKEIEEIESIKKTEVVSGYLNIFFDWIKIAKKFLPKIVEENFGISQVFKNKKIMIEHTSVNPNKALHIGHIRNACLGDSLARIFQFTNDSLVIANYIDDTGAQVADIIVGFEYLGFPLKTNKKFDAYCGNDVYVKVNKLYQENPSLLEKRKEVLKLIEEGNNEIAEFAKEIVTKILLSQLETLWRLKIFYDVLNKESDIIKQKFWQIAVEMLKSKNLVYYDEQNRLKLKLSLLEEFKNLENPDITLVRSDGTTLYVAKDIAYAMWKHGLIEKDFNYEIFVKQPNGKNLWMTSEKGVKDHPIFNKVDISINVIDKRQSYEQNSVKAALELISGKKIDYIHYDYEVVALSKESAKQFGIESEKEIVHMSGRKGIFFNVDDVLEKLKEKAKKEIRKRNENLEEKEIEEIAEKIAVSCLRYEMVKVSKDKMIVFDLEKALSLEENTAAYLLYSYVRANSILKKAEKIEKEFEIKEICDHERMLIKKVVEFPSVFMRAAKELKPHLIALYLFDLSKIFNKFYEFCSVLNEKDEEIKKFRIYLVYSFLKILEKGFYVLGLEKVERM
ncbi:MAG: arginine--tRNA ligase [Candidatus Aenigmarchaeota archaeon ex4484_224]|nr:MAG: arginine--tRNA ligase [Candidatus Aenigmarchaeota archaeon ex4484_224]